MKKTTEMNKEIFRANLLMAISEVLGTDSFDEEKLRIAITPVHEEGKPLHAKDDIMRLILLSDENIKGKRLSVKQTVDLLAGFEPFVPIWVNVSLERIEEDNIYIMLESSLRCRKPSLLRNAESGHPPFKSV